MSLSTRTIEDIKARLDIEDIVSDYVSLRRKGRRLWACCPFHGEKTPSFTVSPELGIYKCFGCGKGGDGISFIREIDSLGYVEALEHLGKRYGIPLTYVGNTPADDENYKLQEGLHALMQWAQTHYLEQLHNHPEGKGLALRYFLERGCQVPTLQAFGVGYALTSGTGMLQQATQQGVNHTQLQQAGLLQSNVKRALFAGRVVFPIHNLTGKVVAFGARTLSNTQQPKYLNSPDTPIYHKHKVLYGLYQARTAMRKAKHAYLVEGYMDVLAMAQAGYADVVAVAGTSLTEEQARLLRRFVDTVTLLFDGDAAGSQATLRAIDVLLAVGLDVLVVSLPEGKDPDSLLRETTKDAFATYLQDQKEAFLTFKWRTLRTQSKETTPIAQPKAVNSLLQSIALVPDELAQHVLIKQCSKEVEIPADLLLKNLLSLQQKTPTTAPPSPPTQPTTEAPITFLQRQEEEVLRLLLLYGQEPCPNSLQHTSLAHYMLAEMEDVPFHHPPHITLIKVFKEALKEDRILCFSDLLSHHLPEIQAIALKLLPDEELPSPQWEKKYNITLSIPPKQGYHLTYYSILRLKRAVVQQQLQENLTKLQGIGEHKPSAPEEEALRDTHQRLQDIDARLSKDLENSVFAEVDNDVHTRLFA